MRIGVLGLGNLGSAIVRGFLKSGISPKEILILDIDETKIEAFEKIGLQPSPSIMALQSASDILLLCIKPKDFGKVVSQLSNVVDGKALVSFVAGLKLEVISSKIYGRGFFRAMPNISCEVGEAAIALYSAKDVDLSLKKKVVGLLSRLGDVYKVEENLIDAFTSLSGSGVAFASETIRSFYEAGKLLGLPDKIAKKVALKVFIGTAKLLIEKDFDDILKRVATPGGTTIEGIYLLEKKDVKSSIIEAIKAAADKASRLSS